MAERTPGDQTGLSAILNVALIVVTIAGFLTLVRQELTSDRPAPPPHSEDGGIGSQTVDVRLWEDPLRSRSNGFDIREDQLDVVYDSLLAADAPDLGPVLAEGVEFTKTRYAGDELTAVLAALQRGGTPA